MTSVIHMNGGMRPAQQWNSGVFDICAPPGGCGLFFYAACCTPCAAGEVAEAAGGSYLVSCCLPILIGSMVGAPVGAFCWCSDRAALIRKYNIAASQDECSNFILLAVCGPCAITQELNHIRAESLKGQQQTIVYVTAPQQQMMAVSPMAVGGGADSYPGQLGPGYNPYPQQLQVQQMQLQPGGAYLAQPGYAPQQGGYPAQPGYPTQMGY